MAAEDEIEDTLSLIIANTQRKKRRVSIPQIAEAIATASKEFNGVQKLSERIGLSQTMINQFLSAFRLQPEVRKLFADRVLDSVDLCAQLASMGESDQLALAQMVRDNQLLTKDVRSVKELRKRDSKSSIADLSKAVVQSNPEKHYVYEFVLRGGLKPEWARDRLVDFLGDENLLSFDSKGLFARLSTNKEGRQKIAQKAKSQGLRGEQVIAVVLAGEEREGGHDI